MKFSKLLYASTALAFLVGLDQSANASQQDRYIDQILKSKGVTNPTNIHREVITHSGKDAKQKRTCVEDFAAVTKSPDSERGQAAKDRLFSLIGSMQKTLEESRAAEKSQPSSSQSELKQRGSEDIQELISQLALSRKMQAQREEEESESSSSESEEEGEMLIRQPQREPISKKGKEKDVGQRAVQGGIYFSEDELQEYQRATGAMEKQIRDSEREKQALQRQLEEQKRQLEVALRGLHADVAAREAEAARKQRQKQQKKENKRRQQQVRQVGGQPNLGDRDDLGDLFGGGIRFGEDFQGHERQPVPQPVPQPEPVGAPEEREGNLGE